MTEELLVRKYSEMNREEIRKMFDLADLRKTRVFQEFYGEGKEETKQELVAKWLSKGMSHKQIADLLEVSVPEVRRLAKASKHVD